jgi:diguanylate cyclase (GGDEF)-like protein/PAS domain S-box-containing protein
MPQSGLAIVRDITETHRAHEALAATELFENAFTNAPIGMALVSLEGTFMKVNGATCELLGYPEPELLALTFQEITHPDDLEADLRQVQRLVAGEIERYSMPKRYYTKAGEEVWANLSVSLVRDDAGEPVHFISQIEDISDRKRLEAALQHLADHDPLTGLWNRRAFDQELKRELARCRRHGLEAALLLVDLNHFKHVNDTYGHSAGDELLRKIAAKLQARLRSTDSIARLGGDEFVIILPNTSLERATRVAAAVEDEVRTAGSHVGEQEAYVTASVGVAALNETTADARAVMADADRAMYRAKQRG